MLLKLFKYDFKAIIIKLLPLLVLLPILAVIVRVGNWIQFDNVFISEIILLINPLFSFFCSLLIVYVIVIGAKHYSKSLFSEQGYLMHTLPVSKHKLLISQLLVSISIFLIALVTIIICVFIASYNNQDWGTNPIIDDDIDILFCLDVIFLMFEKMLVIYAGIALGHSFSKNKGALSLVFCIVFFYLIGTIVTIPLIINFITNDSVGNFKVFLVLMIVKSIIISICSYFVIVYLLKKRLNLE